MNLSRSAYVGARIPILISRFALASTTALCAVHTTGTTLNECARALRKAGAKPVIVATVARVYRQVAEIALSGVPNREENAAVFAEAVAG